MEIKREIKVIEYIEYDGIRFYRDKKGYWLSAKAGRKDHPKRLHIYVWEKHNGPITEGYHVHHIDHDSDNNEIENLVLMEKFEHLSYHANLQNKDINRKNLAKFAQPKAIEWHKSESGIEWHKKQYERTKDKLQKRLDITCINCGKKANVGKGGKGNKYCCEKCKWEYRRKMGFDNIERTCPICNKIFIVDRHNSRKYCSDECRRIARNENKKD